MYFIQILGFLACGESKTDTGETVDDSALEPSNEASIEDTAVEEESFAISGNVVWGDSSPASGAKVQVCADVCRRADVMEDGSWSLSGLSPEVYIVLGFLQGDSTIATTASLIDITADRDIGTMTVYPYATQESFTSGAYEYVLDSGLVLSLNSDDIDPGLYSIGSSDQISSLKIDPNEVPSDIDNNSVVALWMLGDFDHHVSSGISWKIDSDLGLAEGTSVKVKYLDNEAHVWADVGTFTITDGKIDGGDVQLTTLSSLMVVQN